ncbi:hypothetical protein [Desulfovibrio gilichinskyi]|uniref:Uncharacterized protein n=1 Tax=Desulfovibrio gilichinskyi TaxID=1519643 RepID=A0A1X7C109_9BACT|nr:hypothetical protein [Desulfovibrio gilichinskyi]SME88046.1 hypothetical protein SAMN06295933_0106 [Desulfovibrio gilichinskyi]
MNIRLILIFLVTLLCCNPVYAQLSPTISKVKLNTKQQTEVRFDRTAVEADQYLVAVNSKTKQEKQVQKNNALQVVKMSKSGICHDTSSQYYSRTKHYTPFNSLEDCLKAGGRLPKR